jgi:hypothetical protein
LCAFSFRTQGFCNGHSLRPRFSGGTDVVANLGRYPRREIADACLKIGSAAFPPDNGDDNIAMSRKGCHANTS